MARIDDEGHAAEAEETVVVDREAEAETLLVDRAATDVEAETLFVDRAATDVEAETLLVDRAATNDVEAETLLVDRAPTDAANDGTLAVTRQRASRGDPSVPSTGRRRRGMSMPPVAAGYGRGAVDAVGPGAVESYQPRELPDLQTTGLEFGGVEATRGDSSALPSVERRARRTSLVALAVFTASCAVSLGGLIALGVAVFG